MSSRTRTVAVAVKAWMRHAGKLVAQQAQLPVLGPEVVAPLADAVRLVHGDERDAGTRAAARGSRSPPSPTSRSGDT